MASSPKPTAVLAVWCLECLSIAYVSSRYYKSAAFERPFHFSILVLAFSGFVLSLYARCFPVCERKPHGRHTHKSRLNLVAKLRSWTPSHRLLLFCIAARTLLFWRVIRTIHCSWDGLQSFLPLFLALHDVADQPPVNLPRHSYETPMSPRSSLSRYLLVALIWGLASTDIVSRIEHNTGAICPRGLYIERLIPLAQLITVAFDAVLVAQVGKLRLEKKDEESRNWHSLGMTFLTAAGFLALLALTASIGPINIQWNFTQIQRLEVEDLVLESLTVAVAIFCAVYLLGTFHYTTVGLFSVVTSTIVYIEWGIMDGTLMRAFASLRGLVAGLVFFLGVAIMLQMKESPVVSSKMVQSGGYLTARKRGVLWAAAAFALLLVQVFSTKFTRLESSPGAIIASTRRDSDAWIATASKSKTLASAVKTYRERYGIPPPPRFDQWFEFAMSANSSVIDVFDQINTDLLPFWGEPPSVLRERTAHLLEHPALSMGGLIIQGGKVDISPHVHGTHRWMMDYVKSMVDPFAQWLPDMLLAFNLDDECRISVPFDQMTVYSQEASRGRTRLAAGQKLLPFSKVQIPAWNDKFRDADESVWRQESPLFLPTAQRQIFYEWIASTCSANSAVNRRRWWNRKAECVECSSSHTTHGFISNWTLSGDLCHQPDIAYLHGAVSSPSAMFPSHTLLPVFSQSRLQNFADILYPSPWNYGDKVTREEERDIPWSQKYNSLFWRGGPTDGFAAHGSWQTFLRARFVHMSQQMNHYYSHGFRSYLPYRLRSSSSYSMSKRAPSSKGAGADVSSTRTADEENGKGRIGDTEKLSVNVSFVGALSRCDDRDCAAELTAFYDGGYADSTDGPPSFPEPMDFQASWQHRHLVDLDGAGFSGRFLPFLESRSLPYRTALYRTWWEERVHAWRHFVPLDIRLHDLWPALDYLGGRGDADARQIADDGREWAKKALRKEDMQVYMFRLLLEWGRIVDDRREELGFEVS